jgi:hypothetical protein
MGSADYFAVFVVLGLIGSAILTADTGSLCPVFVIGFVLMLLLKAANIFGRSGW